MAITREMAAAIKPNSREFLVATMACHMMSCPMELVPRGCWRLGRRSLGAVFHARMS